MKLIHMADLHLDARLSSYPDSLSAGARRNELLQNFVRVSDYAEREQAAAVLISGDLFDARQVSKRAKDLVLSTVSSHPGILYFYLQGNHDSTPVFSPEELPENLITFTDTWTTYALTEHVKITGAELNPKNSKALFCSLQLDEDDLNIVMLHGQEANVRETGRKAETIPLEALKNRGIRYLALGHIHSYRRNRLDAEGVYCYPGTLEGRGFDEDGPHGFVLLTVSPDEKTVQDEFMPFSQREVLLVKADVTDAEGTGEVKERVEMSLQELKAKKKDLLKVVLTGEREADAEVDLSLLQTLFSDYYMVRVYDETTVHVDYRKYLLDQSLKGEFVRLIYEDDTLSAEEKARTIEYGLRALSGEEILR